jgi:hypothetical protein
MKANKIILGGIVGGVASFLLGWLIYGVLLMDFWTNYFNHCAERPEEEMVWWALILSNFATGFFLAFIFSWSKTKGWLAGAKIAAIAAFFMILSYDLSFYSMSTMFNSFSAVIIDIVIGTVFTAIIGAIIGLVMGMGKKEE